MAVTVAEIIEAARDHHASLDPFSHPDEVALRWISRYHQRLASKVIQINPDALSLFHDISLPLGDFDTGVAANAHEFYLSGKAYYLNNATLYDRVELLPWEFRNRNVHFPAYSILNGYIRLHRYDSDWTMYGSLELRYIAETSALTDPANTITLPDVALDAMSLGLALFLLRRQPEQPYKTYFAELRTEWIDSERAFLNRIASMKKFEDLKVNEVW